MTLIGLPKDIFEYILSIVVYETWIDSYYGTNSVSDINRLQGGLCFYTLTEYKMANTMHQLAMTHPRFQKTLQNACMICAEVPSMATNSRMWNFRSSFFATLSRTLSSLQ